ncbi:MAG: glutathione binding-like protein [Gammaproteobacteria bacterium]|nr:glutathione binding-like protein [Gammaproteobacteria bacterium]
MSARKRSSRPTPSLSGMKGEEPRHNARMDLYMRGDDPAGHAIRLVLAEKGVGARQVEVNEEATPEELLKINPYGSLPCLISRDIVLYQPPIILEYLDERYPHPPLMPFDPTLRARVRLFLREVNGHWYELCQQASRGGSRTKSRARKELVEIIVASEELFHDSPFLMGEDYGLADCVVAPVLWRLPHLHVRLPEEASALRAYMQRCFHRNNFAGSLTRRERVMGTQ